MSSMMMTFVSCMMKRRMRPGGLGLNSSFRPSFASLEAPVLEH